MPVSRRKALGALRRRSVWLIPPVYRLNPLFCSDSIDYFGHVTQVRLVATRQLSDTELIHISHLSRLEELDLHRSPVTDAGLIHLEGLTDLQSLHLFHTGVSDAGLVHLRGLARLRN